MAKKFYAVKNGKNGDGIYDSWEACKAQVHGVKSVVVQGLFHPGGGRRTSSSGQAPSTTEGEAPENPQREGVAVAYVDGSFSKDTGEFACGAVLFWQGERVLFSKKYNDPALAEMHNVAGEILGAVAVIRYCLDKGIPALEIHHDYEGVGKWATGLWKANKPGTQAYAALWQAGHGAPAALLCEGEGPLEQPVERPGRPAGPPGPGQGKIGKVNPIS